MDAADKSIVATPSIFVLPLAERIKKMPRTTQAYQQIEVLQFAVVQVVSSAKDARGGDALNAALASIRAQVKAALAGWEPPHADGEPVTPTGGRLLRFAGDQRIWWSDEFELNQYWKRP